LDELKNLHMPALTSVREAVARAKKEALRAGDEARRAAATPPAFPVPARLRGAPRIPLLAITP